MRSWQGGGLPLSSHLGLKHLDSLQGGLSPDLEIAERVIEAGLKTVIA